jgi:hypothetical protein
VLCVLAGGLEEGFAILVLSIICTAGVGLAFWGPLWWGTGWLLHSLWTVLMSDRKKESPALPPADWKDEVLEGYLKQAEAKGMDQQIVLSRLASMGWSAQEIEHARSRLKAPSLNE